MTMPSSTPVLLRACATCRTVPSPPAATTSSAPAGTGSTSSTVSTTWARFPAGSIDAGWPGAADNATHATVVTGFMDRKVPQDIQTGRIIDCMRRAGDIVAPHGLTLVMEPLNTRTNHPGVYMQSIAQGYAVARGVNSPAVKVLADCYHEQIQSGNILPTLDACWGEIGYIQFGDNPGRKEPGTGEINYANIVRWLRGRNYGGVIGMEHGNSLAGREGEDRLVAAYRAIDQI